MVGISKEDVLDWYQGLSASSRVEIICALLDHSVPFELRFLGSVIENLARKDFHVLREAETKANNTLTSPHTGQPLPLTDPAAILGLLTDGPAPNPLSASNQTITNPLNHSGASNSHSANSAVGDSTINAARPSSSQVQDQRTSDKPKVDSAQVVENGVSPRKVESLKGSDASQSQETSNHVETVSEEEIEIRKDLWLYDGIKRRKLILYLSLMSATNHGSANLYYILLSDVGDLLENTDWLEDLEEKVQDEVLLLYTIGSHHPGFSFDQRTFLSSVLTRFKECLGRYSKDFVQELHPSHLNQILNHHYLPPQQFDGKYGGYIYYTAQPLPVSSQTVGAPSAEGLHTPTAAHYFQPYPSYPMFVSPHAHPASIGHPQPQPFQGNPYTGSLVGSSVPIQTSVLHPSVGSQSTHPPTPTISSPNSGMQVPYKMQSASANQPGPPLSHQSSISTPTRTSSMASAVTAYQSQPNSVDGDSESSSENCAWDSPESSPFESPPQSLTPSRSQSPRSAQARAAVLQSIQSQNVISPTTNTQLSSSQPCLKTENHPNSSSTNCIVTSASITLPRPASKSTTQINDNKSRQVIGSVQSASVQTSPISSSSASKNAYPENVANAATTTSHSTTLVSSAPSSAISSHRQISSQLPAYHSGPVYTHPSPGPGATFNPLMQNGFGPPSCYPNLNHVSGVAMSNSSGRRYPSAKGTPINDRKVRQAGGSAQSGSVQTSQLSSSNSASKNACAEIVNMSSASHSTVVSNSTQPVRSSSHRQLGSQQQQLPAYHPGALYAHPSPGATFIPMQNGFIPPSFFPNHVSGVTMSNSSGHCPPSTDILMNPSHVPQPYPFTFPFSIPPPPQNYGNPNLVNNKTLCANIPVSKEPVKNQYPMGGGRSAGSSDNKLLASANDQGVSYGRPSSIPANIPTGHNMVTTPGPGPGLVPVPVPPSPAQSPMSNPPRPRGLTGDAPIPPPVQSNESQDLPCVSPLDEAIEANYRPRNVSCYNCGSGTHFGPDCKDRSMEDCTKVQYRLNYGGAPDGKEGV